MQYAKFIWRSTTLGDFQSTLNEPPSEIIRSLIYIILVTNKQESAFYFVWPTHTCYYYAIILKMT